MAIFASTKRCVPIFIWLTETKSVVLRYGNVLWDIYTWAAVVERGERPGALLGSTLTNGNFDCK
jgi:hypothetical protein